MSYQVTHRTVYRYESDVSASYGQLHLLPRDLPGQICRTSKVTIDPAPLDYRERRDFFGNRAAYFSILEPHTRLEVVSESIVDVRGRQATLPMLGDRPWEEVRDRLAALPTPAEAVDGAVLDAAQYSFDSRRAAGSPALRDYAAPSFGRGRPLLDAVNDLSQRIHREFDYDAKATDVRTTLDELLALRAGVCQDFAHLVIGCLRSLDLAARYVSGYLETRPPPGKARLKGADVSHAWASVFLPDTGWVDIDPTNDQFVNDRYVTTAWGRDYGDVTPLEGVIYTEGKTTELDVGVDVIPLSELGLEPDGTVRPGETGRTGG